LKYFKRLQKELTHYLEPEQVASIADAYQLAHDAHSSQKRSTGEPYITHPVAVASILAAMRLDPQTIMAALLHDVIEDTEVGKAELAAKFGEEVAELVDGVSKLTQIHFESRAEAQAENFRKMIMAMAKDIRVIIIKLADRLHNMRTLDSLKVEKKRRIAQETLDIYAPIANRLGMHAFRLEYEELGFVASYPLRHRVLDKAVNNARGNRKGIISEIEKKLKERLKKSKIQPFSLKGREKHIYGIFKKMRNKHLSFSEIMDIYGFRVIVDNVDECYRVLGALHNLYKPIPKRFKDYIAIPKANGYQSLHTTLFGPFGVPVEVQIRSNEMDYMAENGIAAHWLYKTNDSVCSDAQERAREWIKGVVEIQQSTGSSLEFIENVKIDLFPDEVYVFTPNGNIMEMPSGATLLDFAYAIHSDIGDSCIAAKVDKRLTPLSTPLASGETVEIITAPGAAPNPSWLTFVTTGKAKSRIRHYIKSQQRDESEQLGRKLVERAFEHVTGEKLMLTSGQYAAVAQKLELASESDLFQAVGLGNRMAVLVAEQLQQIMGESTGNASSDSSESENPGPLKISGTEGLVVHYSRCCHPIPGDRIVGVIDPGQGMFVHNELCSVLEEIINVNPEKILPLVWEDSMEGDFLVDVVIEALNHRGILGSVAEVISSMNSDIKYFSAEEHDDNYCSIQLTIYIKDRVHLAKIFKRIRHAKDILKITRRV
jgi:guanosine-3',5'-bis(diphosphate) 3'-pyrophosphohydrolase